MAGGQQPAGGVGRDHGRREPLRERGHGRSGTGLQRAATRPDQWPLGLGERRGGLVDRRQLGWDRGAGRGRLRRRGARACSAGPSGSRRTPAGSAPPAPARAASATTAPTSSAARTRKVRLTTGSNIAAWSVASCSAPRQTPGRRTLVGMSVAITSTRLAAGPRLADGRERVRRAGSGGRQRDAELAAGAGIAVGGVGRGLLVPYAHQPDRRIAQRTPEREVVDAGQAEGELDPRSLERARPRVAPLSPCRPRMDCFTRHLYPAGATCRRARRGPLARARRAVLHDGARRPRRRRGQGRAPAGR